MTTKQNEKASQEDRKRLLVSGWPFFGHTGPLLHLGDLLASSCDVLVYPYTLEVKAWAKTHGLACSDFPSPEKLDSFLEIAAGRPGLSPIEAEKDIWDWVASVYDTHFESWLAMLEQEKPDLVLLDYSLISAQDACHRLGVPFVSVGLQAGHLRPPDRSRPPWCSAAVVDELSAEELAAQHAAAEQVTAELEAVRKRVLQSDYAPIRNRVAEGPFILGAESEAEPTAPENSYLVGFLEYDDMAKVPTKQDEAMLASLNGEPVVLSSFGSMVTPDEETLDAVIQGIAGAGFRGILQVARRDQLPSHFTDTARKAGILVTTDWIAQYWWLQQKSVVAYVTHADTQAVREALATRTPTLALPQLRDQFYNSARIVESGIGLRILGRPEAAAVTEALEQLASDRDGFAERIRVTHEAMHNLGGMTRAKELLLKELGAL